MAFVAYTLCLALVAELLFGHDLYLPERLEGVKWMHIQKTSSWMGDFLLLYACPHLRPMYDSRKNKVFFYDVVRANTTLLENCEIPIVRNRDGLYGWHDPYSAPSSRGKLITMFRKPEDRIISSFLFDNMLFPLAAYIRITKRCRATSQPLQPHWRHMPASRVLTLVKPRWFWATIAAKMCTASQQLELWRPSVAWSTTSLSSVRTAATRVTGLACAAPRCNTRLIIMSAR
jgi:hypothetical protein